MHNGSREKWSCVHCWSCGCVPGSYRVIPLYPSMPTHQATLNLTRVLAVVHLRPANTHSSQPLPRRALLEAIQNNPSTVQLESLWGKCQQRNHRKRWSLQMVLQSKPRSQKKLVNYAWRHVPEKQPREVRAPQRGQSPGEKGIEKQAKEAPVQPRGMKPCDDDQEDDALLQRSAPQGPLNNLSVFKTTFLVTDLFPAMGRELKINDQKPEVKNKTVPGMAKSRDLPSQDAGIMTTALAEFATPNITREEAEKARQVPERNKDVGSGVEAPSPDHTRILNKPHEYGLLLKETPVDVVVTKHPRSSQPHPPPAAIHSLDVDKVNPAPSPLPPSQPLPQQANFPVPPPSPPPSLRLLNQACSQPWKVKNAGKPHRRGEDETIPAQPKFQPKRDKEKPVHGNLCAAPTWAWKGKEPDSRVSAAKKDIQKIIQCPGTSGHGPMIEEKPLGSIYLILPRVDKKLLPDLPQLFPVL